MNSQPQEPSEEGVVSKMTSLLSNVWEGTKKAVSSTMPSSSDAQTSQPVVVQQAGRRKRSKSRKNRKGRMTRKTRKY